MVEVGKVVKRWDKGWNWLDGRVVVEEVLHTEVGDGTIYVYRVEPDDHHVGDAYFTSFYIATYKTKGHLGKIWGWGGSPREALKDAERKWNEEEKARTEGCPNPFLKALKPLKEKVKEEVKERLEPISDELKLTEGDLEDIIFEDLEDYEYLDGKTVGVLDVEPLFRVHVGDGTVVVYRISDLVIYNNDLPFSAYFYIAVLLTSNGASVTDKTWGLGETVKGALKDAVKRWVELTGGYENPFRKALEAVKEGDDV